MFRKNNWFATLWTILKLFLISSWVPYLSEEGKKTWKIRCRFRLMYFKSFHQYDFYCTLFKYLERKKLQTAITINKLPWNWRDKKHMFKQEQIVHKTVYKKLERCFRVSVKFHHKIKWGPAIIHYSSWNVEQLYSTKHIG